MVTSHPWGRNPIPLLSIPSGVRLIEGLNNKKKKKQIKSH